MRRAWILPVAVVALIAFLNSIYIVNQTQVALRLWFGEVTAVIAKPGLYFKIPMLHEIVFYDNRILPLDTQPLEVTPLDDRRLVVDAFARWRIKDPVVFRKATTTGGVNRGAELLENILKTKLRGVLGGVDSGAVLSADRVALMNLIRDQSRGEAEAIGIEVIDVRIKRADLPKPNLAATFERMRAERQRVAADEIARGNEAAQEIRAKADREAIETTSEAQKQADIVRGQADAKRNEIFAQAYGQDPEFFTFYRSLSAYRAALQGDNTTFVLSPDGPFWQYLKGNTPGPK